MSVPIRQLALTGAVLITTYQPLISGEKQKGKKTNGVFTFQRERDEIIAVWEKKTFINYKNDECAFTNQIV